MEVQNVSPPPPPQKKKKVHKNAINLQNAADIHTGAVVLKFSFLQTYQNET